MRNVVSCVGVAVLLTGCTAQRDSHAETVRNYVREVTGDDLKAGGGGLRVATTNVAGGGGIAKVRGTVSNKFDQTVYGIRYVVSIYRQGDPPRLLDRWQHEVDTTLEPDDVSAMSLEVESMYFSGLGPTPFIIDAQPIKLGDQDMPPPEGWR